jgi:hypothetical protein
MCQGNERRPCRLAAINHHPSPREKSSSGIGAYRLIDCDGSVQMSCENGEVRFADSTAERGILQTATCIPVPGKHHHSTCFPIKSRGHMQAFDAQILAARTDQTRPRTVA